MEGKDNSCSLFNDTPILDEIELRLLTRKDSISRLVLRALAYEAQGFRIAFLLLVLMISISLFNHQLPILLNMAPSIQIMVLSLMCSVLLFVDRALFGRARVLSRDALIALYSADYEVAKNLYRDSMRGVVSPPRDLYLLSLGEAFALSGNMPLGDRYFAESMHQGASRRISIYYALRSRLFSNSLSCSDLEFLREDIAKDPILEVEMCWAHLAQSEYALAIELSRKIINKSSILHPSGIETRDMALLIQSLANLFLGKSEEALIDLDFSLRVLKCELNGIPTLVPYVSLAFLIRGRYYGRRTATRAEAEADLVRGLALCRHPLHLGFLPY